MELSALSFNERVLALAEDERVPLLERVRFLSILGGNLDEFFMTRAAGYNRQIAGGSSKTTMDGLSPRRQLELIRERARPLLDRAYRVLCERLLPELEEHGIRILRWDALEEEDRAYARNCYFPTFDAVLNPMVVAKGRRFPHIRNLRPALVVRVAEDQDAGVGEGVYVIALPGDLPRFVPLPGGKRFVPLEDVIRAGLAEIFPGEYVVDAYVFRVARSANFSLEEDRTDDLLEAVEQEVLKRPFQSAVRLEIEEGMPKAVCSLLLEGLKGEATGEAGALSSSDVYSVDGPVDLFALAEIAKLPIDELHYPPLQRGSPLPPDQPVVQTLQEREILVRFPADSFENTIERFLAEAADDPAVTDVKITLYRTDKASRIVKLLRRARQNGKTVSAVVELRASFDERRNIEWARSLETAGIEVVFGPPRLKVHAKVALVTRREGEGLRRYMYIGTGNLNAATAAAYTDLGLLTGAQPLGDDLAQMFAALTGDEVPLDFAHLLVAPFNMRGRFLQLIEREIRHAREGRGGHIRVKMNGLADPDLIATLYRASREGVKIELAVRGICCLRPGVQGLSENISVVSILGRFLEHPRIFHFGNAGSSEFYIGSADWRPRNLIRRVEVVVPVYQPEHRDRLDAILGEDLSSPEAWEMQPDGSYHWRHRAPGTLSKAVAARPAGREIAA